MKKNNRIEMNRFDPDVKLKDKLLVLIDNNNNREVTVTDVMDLLSSSNYGKKNEFYWGGQRIPSWSNRYREIYNALRANKRFYHWWQLCHLNTNGNDSWRVVVKLTPGGICKAKQILTDKYHAPTQESGVQMPLEDEDQDQSQSAVNLASDETVEAIRHANDRDETVRTFIKKLAYEHGLHVITDEEHELLEKAKKFKNSL